jgi:hypothetical protein
MSSPKKVNRGLECAGVPFAGRDCRGAKFEGLFDGIEFSGADLRGANLCNGLVDATRYAPQPGHQRFGDGLVPAPS